VTDDALILLIIFIVRLPKGGELEEAEVKTISTIREDRGVMSP
jgi:hypothetical protein